MPLNCMLVPCSCLHTDKEYPEEHVEFVTQHNIALHMFDTEENKAAQMKFGLCTADRFDRFPIISSHSLLILIGAVHKY